MLNICSSQKSSTRQAFSSSGTVRGDNIRPMVWLLAEDWKRVFGSIFYTHFWFWQSYVTTNGVLEYSGRFYRYESSHMFMLQSTLKSAIHFDHSKLRSQQVARDDLMFEVTSATVCLEASGWTPPLGVSHRNFVSLRRLLKRAISYNIVEKDIFMNYVTMYESWIFMKITEDFDMFWWYKVKSIHNFFISHRSSGLSWHPIFLKTSEVNLVD